MKLSSFYLLYFILFYLICCLFRTTHTAYGGSQARDPIRATAASLQHSSWQHQILNPLSEARDRTRNLIVPSQIHFFRCTPTGTPSLSSFTLSVIKILWLDSSSYFGTKGNHRNESLVLKCKNQESRSLKTL